MREPDAFERFAAHERRLTTLTDKLERLQKSIVETKMALESERIIGDKLNQERRRFGLLGHLIKNS